MSKKTKKKKKVKKGGAVRKKTGRKARRPAAKKSAAKRSAAKKRKPAKSKSVKKKTKAKKPGAKKQKIIKIKKLPSFRGLSLKNAAAVIGSYLASLGHDPILVGRSCAAVYGAGAVKAGTIDFVIRDYEPKAVERTMKAIGFRLNDYRTYSSTKCPFEVVLLPGPIVAGDDPVERVTSVKTDRGKIKALFPTDCVRQMLSKYYRFGDHAAFEDAVMVARRQKKVDMEFVKRWSEWEWAGDKFAEFADAVDRGLRKRRAADLVKVFY